MVDFPSRVPLTVRAAFGATVTDSPASWTWTDISDYVLAANISINMGRQDEMSTVQAGSCALVLDNQSGDLTPGKMSSPFYPNIRVGTPIQVEPQLPDELAPVAVQDEFDRTYPVADPPEESTWGVSTSGHRWLPSDTVDNTEFSVSGSVGIVQIFAWTEKWNLLDLGYGDVDATFSVSPQQVSTVQPIIASFLYRAPPIDLSTPALGDRAEVYFDVGGSVSASFTINGNTSTVAIPGLSYSATDWFEVRVEVRGYEHKIKVWEQGDPEPSSWSHTYTQTSYQDYGLVGLGGVRITGNTNTAPQLHFGHVEIAPFDPRFFGYVAEWAPEWPYGDISTDTYLGESIVKVTAAGELRRMGQGAQALESAFKRGMQRRAVQPIEYWPMEDGEDALQFASALPGTQHRMLDPVGEVNPHAYTGFLASDSTPTFAANGRVNGALPAYSSTGFTRIFWMINTPSGGFPNASLIFSATGSGSIYRWTINVSDTGSVRLRGRDSTGTEIFTGSLVAFALNGKSQLMWLSLTQNGSNIDTEIGTYNQDTGVTTTFGETANSQTVGVIRTMSLGDPGNNMNSGSFGHFGLLTDTGWADVTNLVQAHRGETVIQRLLRLVAEEQIPFRLIGDYRDTPEMGPQRVNTLFGLLQECADLDDGILYEPRGPGLAYRSRRSMYNQEAVYALDAGDFPGDIVNPFQPVLDDSQLINDSTVTRTNGGSARATDADSVALSGLYSDSVTMNADLDIQLPSIAEWRVYLGTWPGMRYPTVSPALNGKAQKLLPRWRTLNLGDAIEVSKLPPQHGAHPVRLLMQGYSETIAPYRWDVTINASPGDPWTLAYVPAEPSEGTPTRLDTDLATLTSTITESATSISVTTTAPYLWVTTATDPAEFPLRIDVGSETMQVTAITGTSSPQTFAVVREVAGVAAAHTAGTAVHISPIARVAR